MPSIRTTTVLATLVVTAVPAWTKPNVSDLANKCSLGKKGACSELAKLAEQDKDLTVRILAISFLKDQTVLSKLALEDKDAKARLAATKGLTDQTVLAKVAIEDKDEECRKAAVGTLTDQTVLARVALDDKDEIVRAAAVARRGEVVDNLTDQTVLAKVALGDKDSHVRSIATRKLTDQAVLAKIAAEDPDASVRKAVTNREAQYVRQLIAVGDGKPIEAAMARDGSGARFSVAITTRELSQRLTSVEGAQAFFNPSMVLAGNSQLDGVTIAESSVPGKPEIHAVTASVYRSGGRLIPAEIVLPFGAGTVYKLRGKITIFGHIFMSDTTAPLVFLVHDPRSHDPSCNCLQFVHIGGSGHVTLPNGTERKLDDELPNNPN